MTKKSFKYDMQRGLGSCVAALKKMQDAEKEKYLPLVLWGCSRDMAYDAQCEGCRSVYLYELIAEFPDKTPFMDVIEKRLSQCMHSAGWEFTQDCDLLAYFVSDGDVRAWKVLTDCYDSLFRILLRKRRRKNYGLLPEKDNFESLCISIVSLCFDDQRRKAKLYEKMVKDLGTLIQKNALYSFDDFDWFQTVSKDSLGKKTVHRLLHRADADESTKIYVCSMEQRQSTRETEREQRKKTEPQTADEFYMRLKNGEEVGRICSLMLARKFMTHDQEQEVLKLAAYYKGEEAPDIRYSLLRLLANEKCAWTLDLTQLLEDSKSDHSDLASRAFAALSYREDARVRDYAKELLQDGKCTAEAVSMLAANYEEADRDILVNAVKQLPITYDGKWHGAFHDVMDLFYKPGNGKPKELLPYIYKNTLCTYCREYAVKEMGRRRMLTPELLEEMQYDSNEEIRTYADQRLSAIKRKNGK